MIFSLPVILLIIAVVGFIMVNLKGNYMNLWGYMAIWGGVLFLVTLVTAIFTLVMSVVYSCIVVFAFIVMLIALLWNK